MAIRFKCPHCTKPLAVKDELAGKRATCPACKKPIVIPAPIAPPADVEAFAAAALADPAEPVKNDAPVQFVDVTCAFCGESVKFPVDLAGKNAPCPECRRIVKVPLPKMDKPKDWRDVTKKGPTAALMNLPEQLDGAWGTEIKGRVGQEALQEAGAAPEVEVERLGWGGWIRRGAIAAGVLGVLALIIVAANRSIELKQQNRAIQDARDYVESRKNEKDPKKRLHPVLEAEIDRAEGVLLLAQGKAELARQKFEIARGKVADTSKDSLDQDLFLIDLARTQLELGGDEDQIRSKTRMDWKSEDFRKAILRTLQKITADDARIMALRELSYDMAGHKQQALAISAAAALDPPGASEKGVVSPLAAQQLALLYALDDPKRVEKQLPPPDLKSAPELGARLAYAEGYARKGQFDKARDVALANGPPDHQLQAVIAVACALVGDKNNKEGMTQAAGFLSEAKKLMPAKGGAPWPRFQLCRACMQVPSFAGDVQEIGKPLPPNFQRQLKLEWIRAQLAKGDAHASKELAKELPEPEGPARALAWVALGRQLGGGCPVPGGEEDNTLERIFANIGKALANQELGK